MLFINKINQPRRVITKILWLITMLIVLNDGTALGQERQPFRIGVVLHGGHYYVAINGLRDGLKRLGYEEGKHYTLDIKASEGDLMAVEQAARDFRGKEVDLIYSLAGSVTKAVKRAIGDTDIPVVFCTGSDPKVLGLVRSHAKPGGNFTGVHVLLTDLTPTDLTPKRTQIFREIFPGVKRVLTFYNPKNRDSRVAIQLARPVAQSLNIELVERHVTTPDDLRLFPWQRYHWV